MKYQLHHGDCLEVMAGMEAGSVDAVVTDPPYGLEFMGKEWDRLWAKRDKSQDLTGKSSSPFLAARVDKYEAGEPAQAWHEQWATAAIRVLRPSHYLLAFGGTRTWHRLACALEDAGFEIRDTLMWLYSTGFPKSLDVAWAIHKEACVTCGRMVEYCHGDEQAERGVPEAEHDLRFVRATYLSTPVYACAKCGQVLQPFMSEQESPALRTAWRESKTVWPEQSGLAGRGDMEADARELPRCPVCQMSSGVLADGAQGWLRDGASADSGTIPWQVPGPDGSRPSYRPQSREQLSQQPEALRVERLAQTSRGCGTALKPAFEPVILARKPPDGTIARSAIKHGLGALGIEECRIGTNDAIHKPGPNGGMGGDAWRRAEGRTDRLDAPYEPSPSGRWPANVVLDEASAAMLDEQTGVRRSAGDYPTTYSNGVGYGGWNPTQGPLYADSGGASRFFYCAKASRSERNAGCEGMPERDWSGNYGDGIQDNRPHCPDGYEYKATVQNHHPTVKPVALMQWLVRLVAREGDLVLDPFTGSGTTGVACVEEGRNFIGIEREAEYVEIARRRIDAAAAQTRLPV